MCAPCRILHNPIVFRNLLWWGNMPIALSGWASTRVYVRGAAGGWIFLRSYLGFFYVRPGSDECIYDTSIVEVVDIPYKNSPYYVAYMLLPVCEQFHYAYRDPHMRTYQSLRKKSCRILLKIAKLVHMGIHICIRAGKGCTCGGISTKFAYGDPCTHNEIVRIWGATYTRTWILEPSVYLSGCKIEWRASILTYSSN